MTKKQIEKLNIVLNNFVYYRSRINNTNNVHFYIATGELRGFLLAFDLELEENEKFICVKNKKDEKITEFSLDIIRMPIKTLET